MTSEMHDVILPQAGTAMFTTLLIGYKILKGASNWYIPLHALCTARPSGSAPNQAC